MKLYFQLLAISGFLVSAYALYVKVKISKDNSYSPLCDIRSKISCSKALGSRYSVTLGIPNPLGGLFFYLLLFAVSFLNMKILFYPLLGAVLFSIYLAYISYFRQKNFCLVCNFIYLVNLALLAVTLL